MKTKSSSKKPFVTFRFSSIYDAQWRVAYKSLPKHERPYPTEKEILIFLGHLEIEWRKNEDPVFRAIERFSGIKWTRMEQACYIIGSGEVFSDPLTIPVFAPQAPIEYVSDVLCHELIHRNLIEHNFEARWKKIFARLKKKYPKDNEDTLVHVIVHAIHELIFLTLFSKDRLARDKRITSPYPDYRRAWEIVELVGAKKIVDTYLK